VRLLRAGPKPDPRPTNRTFDSKKAPACREFWIVPTLDLLQGTQKVMSSMLGVQIVSVGTSANAGGTRPAAAVRPPGLRR
jgi:hypothetical protein